MIVIGLYIAYTFWRFHHAPTELAFFPGRGLGLPDMGLLPPPLPLRATFWWRQGFPIEAIASPPLS